MKLYKDSDNPVKKLLVLIDKLILSDTGKIKQRLTIYDTIQLFNELSKLLNTSHMNSLNSFVYQNDDDLMKAQ